MWLVFMIFFVIFIVIDFFVGLGYSVSVGVGWVLRVFVVGELERFFVYMYILRLFVGLMVFLLNLIVGEINCM